MYLQHRRIDRGNVAHYYLSFIYYGVPDERQYAAQRTLEKFGSLFPAENLKKMFAQLDYFIESHPDIFDRDKWTQVFTEHTIFSNSKELRLDRMMVDDSNRIIQIVDYKTGAITELNQIDEYVNAVRQLRHVRSRKYAVSGEYVAVDLD
jgi:hypothetical protein